MGTAIYVEVVDRQAYGALMPALEELARGRSDLLKALLRPFAASGQVPRRPDVGLLNEAMKAGVPLPAVLQEVERVVRSRTRENVAAELLETLDACDDDVAGCVPIVAPPAFEVLCLARLGAGWPRVEVGSSLEELLSEAPAVHRALTRPHHGARFDDLTGLRVTFSPAELDELRGALAGARAGTSPEVAAVLASLGALAEAAASRAGWALSECSK